MNQKLGKQVIEVVSLAATIWGIITFIKDEKFIYVATLGVVLVVILFFIIRGIISEPITYIDNQTTYYITNARGDKLTQHKTKRFTVNEKNITTLTDLGYEASGSLRFLSTSMGELLAPIKDGGCITCTTLFPAPLEKGKTYSHTIITEYLDSFMDEKESVAIRMEKKYKSFHLTVHFPSDRVCKQARTFIRNGEKVVQADPPKISHDNRVVELLITKPIHKARYTIEIEW